MVAISSVLLTLGSVASVLASPINQTSNALSLITRATSPGQGTHDGFFYSFWTDGKGSVTYNNEVNPSPILPRQNGKTYATSQLTLYAGWWQILRLLEQRQQLRRRQGLEPRSGPHRNLQRNLERRERELIRRALRLDSQPARRVLRRRDLRQLQPGICRIQEGHHHL